MDLKASIEIKKEKLAYELAKKRPNKEAVSRYKQKIRKHQATLARRRRAKRIDKIRWEE